MFNTSHIHPMLVHFPIALLIVGFLFDIVSEFIKKEPCLLKIAFILQLLGTLGVIAAYISGDSFTNWESLVGAAKSAFMEHDESATYTIWIMIAATAFRVVLVVLHRYKGWFKYISLALFFIGVLCICRTGLLGGDLVYSYLVGH